MYKFVALLKRIVGRNPFLFSLFYFMVKNKYRVANKNTQLVIEGFPRCANTFSYVILKDINPNLNIAHHLHLPVQIIIGVKRKIPVVVLIRDPKDAILSLLLRNSRITLDNAIKSYVSFYKIALRFRSDIILAEFNDVIIDFNIIIKQINLKYNINLAGFENSIKNKEKYKSIIKEMDKKDTGSLEVNTYSVALPNEDKNISKLKLLQKYDDLDSKLLEARILYNKLIINK